jgi:hypothetical protein
MSTENKPESPKEEEFTKCSFDCGDTETERHQCQCFNDHLQNIIVKKDLDIELRNRVNKIREDKILELIEHTRKLNAELQSLRDQLAIKDKELSDAKDWVEKITTSAGEQLAAKEEENRKLREALKELFLIADYYHDEKIIYSEMPYKNWYGQINHAKKLLTPNP